MPLPLPFCLNDNESGSTRYVMSGGAEQVMGSGGEMVGVASCPMWGKSAMPLQRGEMKNVGVATRPQSQFRHSVYPTRQRRPLHSLLFYLSDEVSWADRMTLIDF